jgi:hypothetical protein
VYLSPFDVLTEWQYDHAQEAATRKVVLDLFCVTCVTLLQFLLLLSLMLRLWIVGSVTSKPCQFRLLHSADTIPYAAHVPSFADQWGWIMASDEPLPEPDVKDIDGMGASFGVWLLQELLNAVRLFVACPSFCQSVDLTFDLNGFLRSSLVL